MAFSLVERRFSEELDEAQQRKLNAFKRQAKSLRQPDGQAYAETEGVMMASVKRDVNWWKHHLEGQDVRYLEAGAGFGHGMEQAHELGNVEAHGISLNHAHPGMNPELKERFLNRLFEETVIPDYFHVIQSRLGHTHAQNLAITLENWLNSLKPSEGETRGGGLWLYPLDHVAWPKIRARGNLDYGAYVEYSKARESERESMEAFHPELAFLSMLDTLKQQGFAVPKADVFFTGKTPDSPFNKHLEFRIGRGTQKADLSAFYGHQTLNPIPLERTGAAPKRPPSRMPRTYE
ncbi:hypothetical protein HYV43_01650 [Candidatus Micrarchaeota archaeon]|nr:hypothetical protein [Candidatus Micrarchaeota archaeon]